MLNWQNMSDSSPIRAFDADHVVKLTRLSHAQLRYWDRTGFFRREFGSTQRTPFARIYSFQNVVGLRTLGILRRDYKIPLQHLRKVAQELHRHRNAPWAELSLHVLGRQVYFQEPESGRVRRALDGQYALVPLKRIVEDVADAANRLRDRDDKQIGRIERNRNVVHNAWVVAGTRIPTKAIQRFHEAGYSAKKIIREYPSLTKRDIEAALKHEGRPQQRA